MQIKKKFLYTKKVIVSVMTNLCLAHFLHLFPPQNVQNLISQQIRT